jgi:8-oxo-dGTP diphosphatase
MPNRPSPQIALVCCTLVGGNLAVLSALGGDRRQVALPVTTMRADAALDESASAFARTTLGRAPAWIAQLGAFNEAGLTVAYLALVAAGNDAPAGHHWVSVPKQAVGPHVPLLRAAQTHLRERLDREAVAFRLLPPTFTLSELQDLYELLLERKLHKASFRRTLMAAHLVEPTETWRSEGRGRPAQLFRYAPRRKRALPRAVRFESLT